MSILNLQRLTSRQYPSESLGSNEPAVARNALEPTSNKARHARSARWWHCDGLTSDHDIELLGCQVIVPKVPRRNVSLLDFRSHCVVIQDKQGNGNQQGAHRELAGFLSIGAFIQEKPRKGTGEATEATTSRNVMRASRANQDPRPSRRLR